MTARREPDEHPTDQTTRSRPVDTSRTLNARFARWLLVGVVIAGTLAAVWLVASAVTATAAEVTVIPAQGTTLSDLADADLPAGTSLLLERPTGPLVLHIEDLAINSRILADAADLLRLGLWVGAAAALAGIIGEILAGRPFTSRVSRRLAVLIGIAAIGSFVPAAVDSLASLVLLTGAGITPPDRVFGLQLLELNVAALLAVLVLAALDQAIRHGRKLTDDVEGLV